MFRFKQFTIHQERCAMKVGTDGVLLGAWSKVEDAKRALDIGTGTGLIALMYAQRNRNLKIVGIEIDKDAAKQATENVKASPFSSQIEIMALSLQEYIRDNKEQYDVIVCNPPYFNDSLKAPNAQRSLARHTDSLSFEELIDGVKALLGKEGLFSVILPTEEAILLRTLALQKGLYLQRTCHVFPTLKRIERRTMMQFGFHEIPLEEEELVIELERHSYSDDYKLLTKEFYLDK